MERIVGRPAASSLPVQCTPRRQRRTSLDIWFQSSPSKTALVGTGSWTDGQEKMRFFIIMLKIINIEYLKGDPAALEAAHAAITALPIHRTKIISIFASKLI